MKEFSFKPAPLRSPRRLLLAPYYLEYQAGDAITRIDKENIHDFRHGTEWIIWYRFFVGRRYALAFRYDDNRELRFTFTHYFNIPNDYFDMYAEMVDIIWSYYHQNIVDRHVTELTRGSTLKLCGLSLDDAGIFIPANNTFVRWDAMGMTEYSGYFALFDVNDPTAHARVPYNKYETETLWGIVKTYKG